MLIMILMMDNSRPVGLLRKIMLRTSVAAQWLRLCFQWREAGLVPDSGTKIP